MNKFLKNEDGASGIDIVISIGIISLFATIIAVTFSNLYTSNTNVRRTQIATNYAVKILERVDELYYSEVTAEEFQTTNLQNGKHQVSNIEIPKGYNVNVTISNYNETLDVAKTISVNITYKVGQNNKTIEMQKVKKKEILTIPNKPVLAENMTPVKYVTTSKNSYNEQTNEYTTVTEKNLVKTTQNDETWYDYSSKRWALAIINNDETVIYAWIPRFAYYETGSGNDVKFIYANGQRYVNDGNLTTLPASYNIHSDFLNDRGFWINVSEINASEAANILNTNTRYGPMSN